MELFAHAPSPPTVYSPVVPRTTRPQAPQLAAAPMDTCPHSVPGELISGTCLPAANKLIPGETSSSCGVVLCCVRVRDCLCNASLTSVAGPSWPPLSASTSGGSSSTEMILLLPLLLLAVHFSCFMKIPLTQRKSGDEMELRFRHCVCSMERVHIGWEGKDG